MKTTTHQVEMVYTRKELEDLFFVARREDVSAGGRYDARSAAINVWSDHWQDDVSKARSETVGTFYVVWGDENRIRQIEVDEGGGLLDMLRELAVLEGKALGKIKYGRG